MNSRTWSGRLLLALVSGGYSNITDDRIRPYLATLTATPFLKPMVEDFGAHADAAQLHQIRTAVETSPSLATQLEELYRAHRLVAIRAASEASRSQITSNRPPVNSPTAAVPPTADPALVEPLAHCMLTDEVRADIQGWNDMICERKNS